MITKVDNTKDKETSIFLLSDVKNLGREHLNNSEINYVKKLLQDKKKDIVAIDRLGKWAFVYRIKDEKDRSKRLEACRVAGDELTAKLNELKIGSALIKDIEGKGDEALALAEGIALGNYQFLKYKNDKKEKENSLQTLGINSDKVTENQFTELNILVDAVYACRTLVNEPVSYLNAERLAKELSNMAKDAGIKVEVLNKQKIESLKMGGLLAVNRGSIDPPTFTIMEYKPAGAVNKSPVILVGKGVVFDTGGLNIKTGNFMETMKCDMGGAAMMGSAIYAVAKAKLPVYVVALIPSTDNRPDGNAYAPGDVIHMFDGTNVEILNTDAEGRMILADALSYAKKYKPELVINAATLTGAASRAIGRYGLVAMEQGAPDQMQALKESGMEVYERLAEFPFWEEYGDQIKSEVADIKNLGGPEAGMITAGKFLAHFTDYPFIHLDIAGPAFIDKKDSYRTAGGTGTGVRLLFHFLKKKALG